MRHTHDDLACIHDLPRFRQRLDHYAIGIRQQDGIAGFVSGNVSLSLGCVELRSCRFGSCFDFVIGRSRDRTPSDEIAISRLILRSLVCERFRSGNGLLVRMHGQPQVGGIDAHERFATLDALSGVNQAFQDLARHSKAQVALHAGRDDASERSL